MAEKPRFGVVDRATLLSLSGIDFLRGIRDGSLPAPPFAETTEIWLTEVHDSRVVFEGEPSARFYNPIGTVHGGWISTMIDSSLACSIQTRLAVGQFCTTVDMSVTFVRPVTEKTGRLFCEGRIVHFGTRIATAEAQVKDRSGTIYAHGTETCMILSGEGRPKA
jgi:uncharacterized protein (TIGR00369 family)